MLQPRLFLRSTRPFTTPLRPFSTTPHPPHQASSGSSGLPRSVPTFLRRPPPQPRRPPFAKKTLLVSSAKGGVGKSTLAANLSLALAHHELLSGRVGLLDLDVFGPSVPKLMGLEGAGEPRLDERNRLVAMENYGVRCMSMGFLNGNQGTQEEREKAVVWRGLMVTKAVEQLIWDVNWGEQGVDVLVVDLPPGTGDVQLSVAQQIVIDGAIIVSTPQDIALLDALKGITMFRKTNIPILGMVQNMAYFSCPNCKHESHIFGSGPEMLERECREKGIDVVGTIPLDARICADADRGKPTVVADPGGELTMAYRRLARSVVGKLFPADEPLSKREY